MGHIAVVLGVIHAVLSKLATSIRIVEEKRDKTGVHVCGNNFYFLKDVLNPKLFSFVPAQFENILTPLTRKT